MEQVTGQHECYTTRAEHISHNHAHKIKTVRVFGNIYSLRHMSYDQRLNTVEQQFFAISRISGDSHKFPAHEYYLHK